MTITEKLSLKQWRGLRGMTQAELAEKSGVSTDTITSFENSPEKMEGARYVTLKSIADALEIKVGNFFE